MNTTPTSAFPYIPLSASYQHDNYLNFEPKIQQYNNGYVFINNKSIDVNKYEINTSELNIGKLLGVF